jgi:GT2 family glycosyltransferase
MSSCENEFYLTTKSQEKKELEWPHVGIIVPHYGKQPSLKIENTKECLEAVSQLIYPNFSLVIVDSGSENGFVEEFSAGAFQKSPVYPTSYIRLEENIGYAASCNVGDNFAIEQGASYIFLLNNDTVVEANTLNELVSFAGQHPEIGAIGPKVYDYQEGIKSRRLQTIGGKFTAGSFGRWEEDRGQYEESRPVGFVSGAACLVRAEVIKEIGLFDPSFSIWFEDVDFGVRLRQAGYEAYYYPAEAWHKGAQSLADRFGPKYAYYS